MDRPCESGPGIQKSAAVRQIATVCASVNTVCQKVGVGGVAPDVIDLRQKRNMSSVEYRSDLLATQRVLYRFVFLDSHYCALENVLVQLYIPETGKSPTAVQNAIT